jgi:hypothetical protein
VTMDSGLLIDAIVRQTTVLIAQLATAGGGRAQLAHTANQVFLDLVAALKEQGLGNKVIADMFGMALRTYQTRVQRLSESRTDRGRSLWEALLSFVQERSADGPVSRGEVLRRFRQDDALLVSGVLKDLVDSGLLYRSGRGDFAQYVVAQATAEPVSSSAERAEGFVWSCVHRMAPASAAQVAEALSMDPESVEQALASLVKDGRVRPSSQEPGSFETDGCVLPLGSPVGWEVAVFDHFQAMVMAICAKLDSGRRGAAPSDLIGGSTFSFEVWPEHPHFEEATRFLARFRADGTALRQRIAAYNEQHEPPAGEDRRVLIYAGQTVLGGALDAEDRQ